jgi:hypothetical protein
MSNILLWKNLPDDIGYIILYIIINNRKKNAIKIQSIWRCYRVRVLIGRFKLLRYIKEFREYNYNIYYFISRSRI